jgi:hypothetical protein
MDGTVSCSVFSDMRRLLRNPLRIQKLLGRFRRDFFAINLSVHDPKL